MGFVSFYLSKLYVSPMGSNIESVLLHGCFPNLEHQSSLLCFCGDIPLLVVLSFIH